MAAWQQAPALSPLPDSNTGKMHAIQCLNMHNQLKCLVLSKIVCRFF
ncbi:hypothetical protein RO3G_15342 [Rhizopus delemar RA 99-880]|uniref:Uncharacterized protein n=1 Tax=Rhizopus delemar (strain RA 99-880 / ATCC MYA-4621 / FGSC 9543 / NRRL 43880) TaxID=246409 RepID=I1CQA1_RHIO9|nr:hypothetical protein RO3G_15342 [Rhizopus delemar RA 99-880]|eukprot:EIE90631.1 hypothetical protein RO3G_15342 [Rhizopus delemar RA 99-880]